MTEWGVLALANFMKATVMFFIKGVSAIQLAEGGPEHWDRLWSDYEAHYSKMRRPEHNEIAIETLALR